MPEAIKILPVLDFVFKYLFGRPENTTLLVHILNAVLRPTVPIVDAQILNPFNEKEFDNDKLSIVDIKVRDANGQLYVMEMQRSATAGLQKRLAYYEAGLYAGQMLESDHYVDLLPAITICFTTVTLFPVEQTKSGHLRFKLHDSAENVTLDAPIEIHLIEMPKYELAPELVGNATDLEKWVFFFQHAHEYDAVSLSALLADPVLDQAIGVLEMIARTPDLRVLYDDFAKAERDRKSLMYDLEVEALNRGHERGIQQGVKQGVEQGIKQGIKQGVKQGVKQGRELGREEGYRDGQERGYLLGKIETLCEMLDQGIPSPDELEQLDHDGLQALHDDLRSKLSANH